MAGYMMYLRNNVDAGVKDYMTGKPLSVGLAVNELLEKQLKQEGFLDGNTNHE